MSDRIHWNKTEKYLSSVSEVKKFNYLSAQFR